MILERRLRRVWCSIGSALAGAVVLALVGFVLVAVAFTTRLALGIGPSMVARSFRPARPHNSIAPIRPIACAASPGLERNFARLAGAPAIC